MLHRISSPTTKKATRRIRKTLASPAIDPESGPDDRRCELAGLSRHDDQAQHDEGDCDNDVNDTHPPGQPIHPEDTRGHRKPARQDEERRAADRKHTGRCDAAGPLRQHTCLPAASAVRRPRPHVRSIDLSRDPKCRRLGCRQLSRNRNIRAAGSRRFERVSLSLAVVSHVES